MKYLKIKDNKGYFLTHEVDTDTWIEIDKMGKSNLILLLEQAITEDFEMDVFDENLIQNKAHQIIYKSIYQKFSELLANKDRFKDESGNTYKAVLEKYQVPD